MCRLNGDIVIIDFGLASNRRKGILKDNVLNLSCKDNDSNLRKITNKDLLIYQTMRINENFNPTSNEEEIKEYNKSMEKWQRSCFFNNFWYSDSA
jgi:hypothetical protein